MHICTHTCFLLDKMHIKPPFKNSKDPTLKKNINAIYKITTCTWIDVKTNHYYMSMILLSEFCFELQWIYSIWYSHRVYCQGNFDLSNFHHDFKRSYCLNKSIEVWKNYV